MQKVFLALFLCNVFFCFGQLSFQDNATLSGVGYSYGSSFLGGGVSFSDFNGDGLDDLTFATTDGSEVYFFQNVLGTFIKVNLGINDTYYNKQVIWVDYDNDGDKDFFCTNYTGPNKFYRNDGNLNFTDISATCGLFTSDLYTSGATFGDIDNDGDLDMFICNLDKTTFNQRNYLYRNDSGTFVDISLTSGITLGNHLSFCASFLDYNNDGYQDIYVSNDKPGQINRLFKNNGNESFTDVSVASGAGMAIDAMSTTIEDYNYDGWLDIYVTNTTAGNYHLRNNGDGTFTNVAGTVGTGFYGVAWGAVFIDADNDTDLDLYVSGMTDGTNGWLPSAFYENSNNLFTIPVTAGFANDTAESYANATGDFNNDGYPDIIVMNDMDNNFLWENTSSQSNNWLKVKLEGTTSNRDGIGSKIEISINGQKQYRYTVCGEGYLGQNSDSEIFGLGSAATVDYVKVTWLSGIVDILNNVSANQSLNIIENSTLSSKKFGIHNFTTYPNPSTGVVNIKSLDQQNFSLIIFDPVGKKIFSNNYRDEHNIVEIKNLSRGIYLFNFITDQGEFVKKVVIH